VVPCGALRLTLNELGLASNGKEEVLALAREQLGSDDVSLW
jgi:hypothetical protein